MPIPDENGANFAKLGTDTVTGLEYIIDARTKDRVYRHPVCDKCGRQSWSSVPEIRPCIGCIMDKARSDDARG